MQKSFLTLMLALSMGCFVAGSSRADHASHPEVIRAIQANAEAVKRDAAIYQRKRVASGVGRIVADTRKLQKAMASHACLKADTKAIQKAASDLRAASTEGDASKTEEAVQRLSDLSNSVLQKYCKDDAPLK